MNPNELSLMMLRLRQWFRSFTVIMFLLGIILGVFIGLGSFWVGKKTSVTISTAQSTSKIENLESLQSKFDQANLLMRQGDCAQALTLYQTIVAQQPQAIGALNNIALCYTRQGKTKEAQSYLERAINAQQSLKVPHDNLTRLYAHMANLSYQNVKTGIDIREDSTSSVVNRSETINLLAMNSLKGDISIDADTSEHLRLSPSGLVQKSIKLPIETMATPSYARPSNSWEVASNELTSSPSLNNIDSKAVPTKTVTMPPKKPSTLPIATKKKIEGISGNHKNKSAAIHRALQEWAKAWSNKDMSSYFSTYAKDFRPGKGMSEKAWREDRINKITGKKKIQVDITNIKIQQGSEEKETTVSFLQNYSADGKNLSGHKTISMVLEGSQWKIREENVR